MRSHSVKKPHQCEVCDKGFVNSSSLVLHMRTHAEGDPFPCSDCGKRFKQSHLLLEHMQLHTDAYLYQCSICRKAFKQAGELVQHMKDHTGEKVMFIFEMWLGCERSLTTTYFLLTAVPVFHLRKIFHTARKSEYSHAYPHGWKGKISKLNRRRRIVVSIQFFPIICSRFNANIAINRLHKHQVCPFTWRCIRAIRNSVATIAISRTASNRIWISTLRSICKKRSSTVKYAAKRSTSQPRWSNM